MKLPDILSFKHADAELFEAVKKIRNEVFIIEQQVREEEEFDEFENSSIHYLLSINKTPIGTARWRHVGDWIKLERFAVLKDFRGEKNGDFLLKSVLDDVLKENKPLYLHAQLKAIPFYERRGFRKVGELFWECEIAHYKMTMNDH